VGVILVLVVVALLFLGAVYLFYRAFYRQRDMLSERFSNVLLWIEAAQADAKAKPASFRDRLAAAHDELARRLQRAGMPFQVQEFLTINEVAMVVVLLLTWLLTGSFWIGFVLALLWPAVPYLILQNQLNARTAVFERQLSPALTMIENSLSAGNSFPQSMEFVAQEMEPPLSLEFGRVARQMALGMPMERALGQIVDRMESDDLRLVVTAVLIQRETGGNLVEVIRNINALVKDRIRIRESVRALTAQGRMSTWIVGLLPFAIGLAMYLMNPSYMQPLVTTPAGIALILGALISEGIGVLIIRRIVNIKI